MPIIKRAIKKLRHDRRRTVEMTSIRSSLESIIKATRKSPTEKKLAQSFQALDKAAKLHIIHPNKAARLKSKLSKLLKRK